MPAGQEELLTAALPALIADVLREHGHVRMRALGSSMLPAIRPGDVLRVEPCTADDARPGEVLLMRHAGRIVAHRLLRTRRHDGQTWLVTRGDALWHTDPDHPASMLLGRVTAFSRGGVTRAISRTNAWPQRLYGVTVTEATRVSRALRAWVASFAAAARRTTIGSASSST